MFDPVQLVDIAEARGIEPLYKAAICATYGSFGALNLLGVHCETVSAALEIRDAVDRLWRGDALGIAIDVITNAKGGRYVAR